MSLFAELWWLAKLLSDILQVRVPLPSRPKESRFGLPYPLHPHSTLLPLFRDNVKTSAVDATPVAMTVYQTHLEVSTDSSIVLPLNAVAPPDFSVLGSYPIRLP